MIYSIMHSKVSMLVCLLMVRPDQEKVFLLSDMEKIKVLFHEHAKKYLEELMSGIETPIIK